MRRLEHLKNFGYVEIMLIDLENEERTEEMNEGEILITGYLDHDVLIHECEEQTEEFDTWICDILQLCDKQRSQDA